MSGAFRVGGFVCIEFLTFCFLLGLFLTKGALDECLVLTKATEPVRGERDAFDGMQQFSNEASEVVESCFAFFDEFLNLARPTNLLFFGETDDETTCINNPPEDTLFFNWCSFGLKFVGFKHGFSRNGLVVGEWASDEMDDEWDDARTTVDVGRGCQKQLNHVIEVTVVVSVRPWRDGDCQFACRGEGNVVGKVIWGTDTVLEGRDTTTWIPIVKVCDVVAEVGADFGNDGELGWVGGCTESETQI